MQAIPCRTPSECALGISVAGFFVSLFAALAVYLLPWSLWRIELSFSWVATLNVAFVFVWCSIALWWLKRKVRRSMASFISDDRSSMSVIYGVSGINLMWTLICWYGGIPGAAKALTFFPSIMISAFAVSHVAIRRMAAQPVSGPMLVSAVANTAGTLSSMIWILRLRNWPP